jgi:hypothetical protein
VIFGNFKKSRFHEKFFFHFNSFVFFPLTGTSQTHISPGRPINKTNDNVIGKLNLGKRNFYKKDTIHFNNTVKPNIFPLAPGVYQLPQDNLPCIVPDLTATAPMPNAFKEKINIPYVGVSPLIPNPALPPKK